ncbi:MAG TPA: hypothetical protein PKE21_17040 [Flavobacteriales bacterium]|nr:hypothetical protein [Flavobacteriales bacterium]HMR29185.1 hypothetical protein [Flavobacteriales bacterium]
MVRTNKILIPLLLGAALFSTALSAQTNFSGFNYQAVVRDTNGDPLPNQNVGVQLVISCGILQPYVEDHSVTTDANGLMDLVIGEGTPVFGSAPFNTIDWSGCGTWTWNVTVSMDITGGTNYSLLGSQQMKAVPFALNALSTANPPLTGWALVGNDVHNTNTGNVGVGTSTPAHKLDVQGSINAGGGLYVGDEQTITYDGAGRTEFFDEAGIEHMEFNGYNTTFGAQPTYITDQFAIGLDPALELPAADLHVKGTFRLEDGNEAAGKVLTSDADGNASWGPAAAATGWALNGADLHNTNNGNVGIGTSTPTSRLTLSRDVGATTGQLELSQTHGITDGEYDGLFFKQRYPGSPVTDLGSFRLVNKSSGYPDLAFYTRNSGTNNELERMRIMGNGNVGIGTSTPSNRLTVSGHFGIGTLMNLEQVTPSWGSPALFTAHRYIQTNTAATDGNWKQFNVGAGGVSIGFSEVPAYASTDALYVNGRVGIGTNGPGADLEIVEPTDANGAIVLKLNNPSQRRLEVYSPGSDVNAPWVFDTPNSIKFRADGNDIKSLYLDPNGNVGIGTLSPQSKLAVNGKITCKEVEVTLANFPDYVFDEGYDLMTLDEVAAYIRQHGHLPNVPSACEVEENGLGLGEMNRILLEKVEELTLHLIEKDRQLKRFEERLAITEQRFGTTRY